MKKKSSVLTAVWLWDRIGDYIKNFKRDSHLTCAGAPLTDRATEVIAAFHAELKDEIPIIGVGGIMTADHARQKLDAGATLVQLYTGFIYHGPQLIHDIVNRSGEVAS